MESSPVYEILFGGWSNSKSVIRKHGIQQRVVTKSDNQEAVIRQPNTFLSYWITIYDDWVYAGAGELGSNEILRWQDSSATSKIKSIGISSWNTPLQFKNIFVCEPFIPKIHTFELNGKELFDTNLLSDGYLNVRDEIIFIHKGLLYCWNESFVPQEDDILNNENIDDSTVTYEKSSINSNDDNNNEENESISLNELKKLERPELVWDSLEPSLVKKILSFMYSGVIDSLSSDQIIQLMNFASKQSLPGFLEYLQDLTCDDDHQTPSVEVIISRIIKFKPLFRNSLYHDIVIVCDGNNPNERKSVTAHKFILSLWSDPFKAMFSSTMKESSQKEIYLPEVGYREFKLLLQYCYTGSVNIPPDLAISTLILADRFGITPLQTKCCEVVVNYIDIENCCALMEMAALYSWTMLHAHCIRFIETNFENVVQECGDYKELSPDALMELILSDDLMVSDEYVVYKACIKWIKYNYPSYKDCTGEKKQLLIDLLMCIRYPLLPENILETEVVDNFFYKNIPQFKKRIDNSIEYLKSTDDTINLKDMNSLEAYTRRPRTVYNHHQLLFSHCGDRNGVCYFIGCNYGKNTIWQNPHKAKRLTISLSSPPSRYSRADSVVSRSFSTTNFISGSPPWIMIDFGENHELICNHYMMRLDNSNSYIKNWKLQASNSPDRNDNNWVTLRNHNDEEAFQEADWAVFGKSARFPYRYFRIITSQSTKSFGLSTLELYGYFT